MLLKRTRNQGVVKYRIRPPKSWLTVLLVAGLASLAVTYSSGAAEGDPEPGWSWSTSNLNPGNWKIFGRKGDDPGRAERQATAGKNPNDKYQEVIQTRGRDLVQRFRKGSSDPFVGRNAELVEVTNGLNPNARNKKAVVVSGDAQVGKSSLIRDGLAKLLAGPECPADLQGVRLFEIDMNMIKGNVDVQHADGFEKALRNLVENARRIKAASKSAQHPEGLAPIIFIDSLAGLIKGGQADTSQDALTQLILAVEAGEMQLIVTAESEQARLMISEAGFDSKFTKVKLTASNDPMVVLLAHKAQIEITQGIKISLRAVERAYDLSKRLLGTGGDVTGTAVSLLEAAAVSTKNHRQNGNGDMQELKSQVEATDSELAVREDDRLILKRQKAEGTADWSLNETRIVELHARQIDLKAKLEKSQETRTLLTEYYKNIETISRLEVEIKAGKTEKGKTVDVAKNQKDIDGTTRLNTAIRERLEPLGIKEPADEYVGEAAVEALVAKRAGIPASRLSLKTKRNMNLKAELSGAVLGQEEATEGVAAHVQAAQAGWADPNKPMASFMLVGPTGTGKTFLFENLATLAFDSKDNLLVIECGNLPGKEMAMTKLWGASAGYVNSEKEGQLSGFVRRKPYSIVLFDELEKVTDPEIMDVILNILDRGWATDGRGRVIDFRNAVVGATTNMGQKFLLLGVHANDISLDLQDAATQMEKGEAIENIGIIKKLFEKYDLTSREVTAEFGRMGFETPKLPEGLKDVLKLLEAYNQARLEFERLKLEKPAEDGPALAETLLAADTTATLPAPPDTKGMGSKQRKRAMAEYTAMIERTKKQLAEKVTVKPKTHAEKLAEAEGNMNARKAEITKILTEGLPRLQIVVSDCRERTKDIVRTHFRRELVARFTDVLIYDFLSLPVLRRLVDKELKAFQQWEAPKKLGIEIRLSKGLKELLARQGRDPEKGARLVKSRMDELVKLPVSDHIMKLQSEGVEIPRGSVVEVGLSPEIEARIAQDRFFVMDDDGLAEFLQQDAKLKVAEVKAGDVAPTAEEAPRTARARILKVVKVVVEGLKK